MAQTLFTGQTPAVPNGNDGPPGLVVATCIIPQVEGEFPYVRFYAPATVTGTWTVAVHDVDNNDPDSGGGNLLASKVMAGSPVPSAWNIVYLDSPVPAVAGVAYKFAVHNSEGRYVTTNDFFNIGAGAAGILNGDLYAPYHRQGGPAGGGFTIDQGTFVGSGTPTTYPYVSYLASCYFVDCGFDPASGPAEGAAALGLNLAVAATGARSSSGAAALGLGIAVAAQGSSPASGSVALTLGLAVAATGARASVGTSDTGLGLAVAATGARSSSGSAALGLNLAVLATGSNGDTGRPVSPFPFTPRPGSTYPWTPRPVKSFQEVDS